MYARATPTVLQYVEGLKNFSPNTCAKRWVAPSAPSTVGTALSSALPHVIASALRRISFGQVVDCALRSSLIAAWRSLVYGARYGARPGSPLIVGVSLVDRLACN